MPTPSALSPAFRHARRVPRRHVLRAFACVLAAGLMFTGTGAWALYRELTGNINSGHDLADFRPTPVEDETAPGSEEAETTPPPSDPKEGQVYNILLMGSDSRQGENAPFGDEEGARADTTILLHIAADRSRVEAVSIPRDLLTDIPPCPMDTEGKTSYDQSDTMFNAAFATGAADGDVGLGAVCTALTVEKMTGMTIDDYAVVDFVGFQRMVDTIGGVPMCISEAMHDDAAGLDLAAGQQTLNGAQALALARARKHVGDGSDISRIGRQQELLAAVVRQLLAKNLVTDSYSLVQFLDAATSSLTTSPGLSNPLELAGLAIAVAPVGASGVTFVTMPFDYAGNRVVANAQTDLLWARLRADEPVNSAATAPPTAEATPAADADSTDTAPSTDTAGETPATPEPNPAATDPWTVTTGSDSAAC